MRFQSLALERYGAFCDRQLHFAAGAHLHVVHGPNEAGKTSALAAIGDLLFGFGHTTAYGFVHDQNTLRVGATLRLADGSALTLRRRKGRGITLLDERDRTLDEDPLAALMGGVDRQTFSGEFGLTAEALRRGGAELMKAGGRLAESLAASSAGLSALSRQRCSLEGEADALFRPTRVASKEFYVAFDRHKAAEQQLRDGIVTIEAWKAASQAVTDAADAHAALQQEEDRLRTDLSRRERARRTRPKLLEIAQIRADLAQHADLGEIAAETLTQWQRALADEARLSEQLAELEDLDARDRARVEALTIDDALAAAGPTIDAFRERIGAIAKAREDLPRRIGARRVALDALTQASRRLGLDSPENLLARQPTDAAMARARTVLAEGRRAVERLAEAERALADAAAERDRLQDDAREAGLEKLDDPAPLKRRLDAFADVPLDAVHMRREQITVDRAAKKLSEEAAVLDPPVGHMDAVALLPLPAVPEIARAAHEIETLDAELKQRAVDIAGTTERIRRADREIAKLAARGAIATWSDLRAAREVRDGTFAALDGALEGLPADRRRAFEVADQAGRAIDELTDRLLADVDRASRSAAAHEQREEVRAQQVALEERRDAVVALRGEAQQAWQALWSATAITPLAPARMAVWRERIAKLLEARTVLDERRSEGRLLAMKLDGLRPDLALLAREIGITAATDTGLEVLYREVAAGVEALQQAWAQARTREIAIKTAAKAAKAAEAACERIRRDDRAWRDAWPAVVGAIDLPPEAGFAEAEAALAVWQVVPADKRAFEREGQSVDGIERDLAAFETDVGALVARVAADLCGRAASEALAEITRRLATARKLLEERVHLSKGIDERGPKKAGLGSKVLRAGIVLDAARSHLDLGTATSLQPVLDRLEARQALETRHRSLLADLRQAADGLDEAALEAEQTDLDLLGLDDLILAHKRRLTALTREDIGAAHARAEQAKAALAALAAGRDAEGAAQAKQEAATDMLDIAERWLVRAAAAKLAAMAIDRHRASVQDPLVARASELFATVTSGVFSGLATRYDDKDVPVLVGQRTDGRTVDVEGMSEGTRDQLFLVLRLALLEQHRLAPLPFVGDDLMASFDETRTGQALDVLAAFGQSRQVILFTHHAHVADIAHRRLGQRADMIAL